MRRVHLINFVRKAAVLGAFFLAPLHFLKLGFSGLEIGVIASGYGLAPLVFSFPTGWTNDRFSMKRVILASLLAQSAVLVLIGLAREAWLMAGLFLVFGMANNVLDVSINSLYYKNPGGGNPNRKYGTYNFWLSLGPPAGILAGGALMGLAGYRALLGVFAGLTLLLAPALRGLGGERFSIVRIKEYRSIFLKKNVLAFSLCLFVLALHWGVEGTVYAPFLRSRFGLDDFQVGLYISLAYLALAFSSLAVSRLGFNPERNRRLFLLGMALSGLGLILMVQHDVRMSFLFRVIHEGGDGVLGALAVLYISGLFEKRTIGGSAGILTALQTSGQMAGALAFSTLGFRAGLQYPFIIAGALLLANAAFGLYAVPQERGLGEIPAPA
jgi:MFS family permease